MSAVQDTGALADKWFERLQSESDSIRHKPKSIYHYTNADCLVPILATGIMYATDFRFLNDRTEFLHGRARAESILKSRSLKISELFRAEVLDYLNIDGQLRSFVVSFSSRRDDLSQWRGYANDGDGFTLGFSTNHLCEKANDQTSPFAIGEVNYLLSTLRKQINGIASDFFSEFLKTAQTPEDLDLFSAWCEAIINSACSLHKHNSFRFEKEWRIVDVLEEKDFHRIKVRSQNKLLIPYVEVDLRDQLGRLPLTSIGIGPSFTHPYTKNAVEDLCNQFGYSVEVYEAKTPYVRR